ncbi:MAG: ribonuclease HI family protein [Deltaproteobacteria bacterium]
MASSSQLRLSLGIPGAAPAKSALVWTDGACRGNPGASGAGALIKDSEGEASEIKKYLGTVTNNQAEYEAFIAALEAARRLEISQIKIHTDSLLLANQVNGAWRVKDEKIKPLHAKALSLIAQFEGVRVVHIPREENRAADRLANQAIDEYVYSLRGE